MEYSNSKWGQSPLKIKVKLMLNQNTLLRLYGLDEILNNGNIKMIRHQDGRYKDFDEIVQDNELLEEYQSYQSKDIYKDCKYLLIYISCGKTHSLFYGFYEVSETVEVKNFKVSEGLKSHGHIEFFTGFKYKLKKLNNFFQLEKRLIIDWGSAPIVWHQWLKLNDPKNIIEIKANGYVKDFPGYLDIMLSYKELQSIIENKEVNKTWYDKLSSIYAIYLILDSKTGNLYIGSASGKDGLWGRWSNYANNIHGGNKALVKLVEDNNNYKYNFQYSILHVLSASKGSEIERYESLYKEKLGSRAFGLNEN